MKREFKNIINKKTTLLELDNYIQANAKTSSSLFDDLEQVLENKNASYYLKKDGGIYVQFEIIKKDSTNNCLDTIVKIVDFGIF